MIKCDKTKQKDIEAKTNSYGVLNYYYKEHNINIQYRMNIKYYLLKK